MTRFFAPIVFASILLSACGGQTDAQKVATALTGSDKADSLECQLFTPAEIAAYIGEPVSAGHNATSGCQWVATDGTGDVMVAVVPSRYHEIPSLAEGFRKVPDVGSKGFVVPELGGWAAGAIAGDRAVRILVTGATAGDASAIALLKESIKRSVS